MAVPGAVTCVRIVAGTLTQRPHAAPLGSKQVVGHIHHRLHVMRLVGQGVLPNTRVLPHRLCPRGSREQHGPQRQPQPGGQSSSLWPRAREPIHVRCVIPSSLPADARHRLALREAWAQSVLVTGLWGSARTADQPLQLCPQPSVTRAALPYPRRRRLSRPHMAIFPCWVRF